MTFRSSFQILDEVSRRAPERPFLHLQDGSSISYGGFRGAVERLASHLHYDHGVRAADRVAVHHGNTLGFCMATFATLRLGGTVVPLNIKLRLAERHTIIDSARPNLVVADRAHAEELRALIGPDAVSNVDDWIADDSKGEWSSPNPPVPERMAPDDAAFIMYTSGTTGKPKGVIVTHANVLRACQTYCAGFGLNSDDVTVIAVPIFHGTGLFGQLFPLLFVGGGVVLQERYDTETLLGLIESHHATHFIGVPTMHTYLLQSADASARLASLRKVGSGGAPLPTSVAEDLAHRLYGAELFNTYGMTETTSPATMLRSKDFSRKLGSIGVATPGMRARIVNSDTERDSVPGEIGELLLTGDLVTPGYWDNPEATRDVFSDEWLRTGDLASMDAEGYIYLCGRIKDMISRGGEKIYPDEVEEVLLRHEDVAETNVFGIADSLYGEVVKAQIVPAHSVPIDPEELTAWCAQHLAKFKVPAEFEVVDQIPKNASGKPLKPRTILPS